MQSTTTNLGEFTRCTNAEHTHHDNGGAARDWNVLSIRPPLRGAMALHAASEHPACVRYRFTTFTQAHLVLARRDERNGAGQSRG